MEFHEILEYVSVANRDNGRYFIDTQRADKIINLLFDSKYRKVNSDGLYMLYSAKPLCEVSDPIIISTHIDCVSEITNCFTRDYDQEKIIGTFDNCITNAAILTLMVNNRLPENVLVAFTGDEESGSKGATQLSTFLAKRNIYPPVIVLDVTNMGWNTKADFTIENNLWDDTLGYLVIKTFDQTDFSWKFVPSDIYDIPDYVDNSHIIRIEAEEDESWEYDEHDLECFSFCLPVSGEMHGNNGVLARKTSCTNYIEALLNVIKNISSSYS